MLLVFNASSVAVLWFGGQRVAAGGIQVGGLIAFLSYLMQILFAVMMATFMAVMIPRAAVCAERIMAVLNTKSSVAPSAEPIVPQRRARHRRLPRRRISLSRRRAPSPQRPLVRGAHPGDAHRDHRQHRIGEDDAPSI